MDNRCMICGEIIPEGIEVCPSCAYDISEKNDVKKEEDVSNG